MFIKLFLQLLILPVQCLSGSCFFNCQLYWLNNRRVYECTGNSTFPKQCDSIEPILPLRDGTGGDGGGGSAGSNDPTVQYSGRLIMASGTLEIPSGIMALHIRHAFIDELKAFESPEVVTLVLEDCNLATVDPKAFRYAQNLHHLDLSNNLLKTIDFIVDNSKIDKLILSNNLLTGLPRLNALSSLRYLYLSSNLIRQISGNSLLLPKLDYVDLSWNELKTIRRTDLSSSIKVLVLDGNPWRCDCNLRDFVEFQRATYITRSLECAEPDSVKGKIWNDLLPMDFACGPYIEGPFLNDLIVTEGDSFSLSCSASGDPIPLVQFKRSTSKKPIVSVSQRLTVNQSSHGNLTTKILAFQEALPSDAGTYWCLAKAGLNTSARRFDIEIKPPIRRSHKCRKGKCGNANTGKSNEDSKSGGIAVFLTVFTILLIILSFLCFILAMYYKRKKVQSDALLEPKKRSFTALPRLVDQLDSEIQSSKELLYEEPTRSGGFLFAKPNGTDAAFQSPVETMATDTLMVTEIPSDRGTVDSKILETPLGSRVDLCPRKAPLAQYDHDTYVFPIVQTSL